MSKVWNVNNTAVSTPSLTPPLYAMWNMFQCMLAVGWTMVRSSDGTTFGAGVHVTTPNVGAGGMGSKGAWIVLQQPSGGSGHYAGTRQFMFQRSNLGSDNDSTNYGSQWYIQYSLSAGFTGGSAMLPPSATDGYNVTNSGTPSSPSYDQLIQYSWGGCRYHAVAASMDDPDFPGGFYCTVYPGGGGNNQGFFLFDPQTNLSSADTDPYVIMKVNSTQSVSYQTNTHHCWWNPGNVSGGVAAIFDSVYPFSYLSYNQQASPQHLGANPVSGLDDLMPVFWGACSFNGSTSGYKGTSRMVKWRCNNRATGDSCSVASPTAKDYVVHDDIVLPWNGSTPLV